MDFSEHLKYLSTPYFMWSSTNYFLKCKEKQQ